MPDQHDANPCLSCGACCVSFRVSFYWGECDDAGGCVPAELTEQLTPHRRAMRGTLMPPMRCVALTGEVTRQIGCSIYDQRPSPCREFSVWEENGTPSPRCTQARARIGLPELPPIRAQASDAERRVN